MVTYELFDELRRVMDVSGETPTGLLAMAVLQIDERLRAVEKWQDAEDTRSMEASGYNEP